MSPEVKISLVALLVFVICVIIILRPKVRRRKPGRDGADASGLWFTISFGGAHRDQNHGNGFDSGDAGGGGDGGD